MGKNRTINREPILHKLSTFNYSSLGEGSIDKKCFSSNREYMDYIERIEARKAFNKKMRTDCIAVQQSRLERRIMRVRRNGERQLLNVVL